MNSYVALHGFLGLPSDWQFADNDLKGLQARELWKDADLDFNSWAQKFTQSMARKPVLIGYSMGGRLAMHAALLAPQKFSGAVFISAHPGLSDEGERAKRVASDHVWAERFATEPWAEVVAQWNAQGVLQSPVGQPLERKEQDFDRSLLAQAMDQWSLGRQADLRLELERLALPVLFVSGSHDPKFTGLLKALNLGPGQKHVVIEGAGHRVPWDQPQNFVKAVKEFARKL